MILIGSLEGIDLEWEVRAFETPAPSRTRIAYDGVGTLPEYIPYLVRISDLDAKTITYNVLNPNDLSRIFAADLVLDRTDLDSVWSRLPSTLDGWEKGVTDCALLFLTERYVTKNQFPAIARPGSFGPCTKWPCAAADLRGAMQEINQLRSDNVKLLTDNTRLLDENAKLQRVNAALDAAHAQVSDEHAKVATSYAALKQRLNALRSELTPEQLARLDRDPCT